MDAAGNDLGPHLTLPDHVMGRNRPPQGSAVSLSEPGAQVPLYTLRVDLLVAEERNFLGCRNGDLSVTLQQLVQRRRSRFGGPDNDEVQALTVVARLDHLLAPRSAMCPLARP